jgi:CO dehydrogenase/acetyl-CoA synthase beta subunit
MDTFDAVIDQLNAFAASKGTRSREIKNLHPWPAGGSRNIVIGDDVGVELGSPQKASVAALIWTGDSNRVFDNRITLVGPDIGESPGTSLSFGKIVLAEVEGLDEDNAFHRYMEMEGVRYDVDLKGYMIRAVSKTRKEWCRISREAVLQGFDFDVLGAALIQKLKQKPYVKKVELIFITSGTEDVRAVEAIVEPAQRVIAAMNKMINESVLDCGSCDYNDVCSEVEMLGAMREKLQDKQPGVSE